MKRALLLPLALLLAAMPLLAQQKAVLKGKVQKGGSDEIFLASLPSLLYPEESRTVADLQKGEFRIELPLVAATTVELVYGNESVPVYLEPGFDLSLSFTSGKMLKTIRYSGNGANENEYLALHTLRFDEEEDYQTLPDNVKLPEAEFIKFLEYRKEDQISVFEKKAASKGISDAFKKLMLAEIETSYLNDRLTFFDMRERMMLPQRLSPSAGYFNFLNDLNLKEASQWQSLSFPMFLRNYMAHLAKQANLQDTDKHFYRQMYDLASQKLEGEVQAMAKAHIIRQSLQKGNVLHAPALLQDFGSNQTHSKVYRALQQQYENLPGLGIGSAAPDFSLYDVNGNLVSLQDFRGKIVYLSFWQTDCGICMVEQPHAQELARKLQRYDVAMVHIGVDDSEQTWRNTVQSRGLSGVQLYMAGKSNAVALQYGLKEVPAYFLIDETGAILSTKPRRPIDREAEKEILQHIMRSRAAN